MKRKLFLAFAAAAFFFAGLAHAQAAATPTRTPTKTRTPTLTPTSTRTCDLSMAKSASPDPGVVGDNLTYTLVASNLGPSDVCTYVEIQDKLPADVSFVSVSPSEYCRVTGGVVTCDFDWIVKGLPVQVVIVVTPTKAGSITNTASVYSGWPDPNPGNNTATITTSIVDPTPTSTPTRTSTPTITPTRTPTSTPTSTPTPSQIADLSLAKSGSPDPARVSQDLTYRLKAINNGPSLASGVSIRDQLPAEVSFVSVSPSSSCGYSRGIVICGFSSLSSGSAVDVVIVTKSTKPGHITNFAEVSSSTFDPNPANNVAVITTDVEQRSPTAYLQDSGSGTTRVLYLDGVAPTAAVAKYKDSALLRSGLTDPWVEIGTWSAPPPLFGGTLGALDDLHAWLGLKSRNDEGTQFDLRAEVWKNGIELVASGESACVQGLTRDPEKAREIRMSFDLFSPVDFDGTTDLLSLKVLTRIGKRCPGPNRGSAAGLRLYFDSVARPSGLWIAQRFEPTE